MFEPFWSISLDLGSFDMPALHFLGYNFWPSPKIEEPYTPILKKKIVRENHGTSRVSSWDHFKPYLSHFGALVWIWEASIYPSDTFYHFWPISENWGPLHPNFEKKIVWGHPGSWRASSWDHFKPYLSLFGVLVWILEGFLYRPVTFERPIFGL